MKPTVPASWKLSSPVSLRLQCCAKLTFNTDFTSHLSTPEIHANCRSCLYYWGDGMLSKAFHWMAVQVYFKSALPLARVLATASDHQCNNYCRNWWLASIWKLKLSMTNYLKCNLKIMFRNEHHYSKPECSIFCVPSKLSPISISYVSNYIYIFV